MFSTIILARSFPCLIIYMHSSVFGCVTQLLLSNIINIFIASFALYHSLIQTLPQISLIFQWRYSYHAQKLIFRGGGMVMLMALRLLKFISTKWVYGQHFSWALVEAIKTKPWLWGGSVYWVHNYLKHSWIQSRVMACFVSWKSLWALSKPWNICKIKFKSLIHKPSQ